MNRQLPIVALLVLSLASCLDQYNELNKDINPEFGSFIDSRDGMEYATVKLRNQTWMAENLAYLPAVSPSNEGSEDIPYYYVYDYQGKNIADAKASSNYTDYGVLYSWHAAMGVCPSGWRLPTDQDWSDLEMALGLPEVDTDRMEWRELGAVGKKMKSKTGWELDGNGTNESGFNAYPAGSRNGFGSFVDKGKFATFWTATEDEFSGSWYRSVRRGMDGTYRAGILHNLGLSVRCVRN